jgi:hypothetical protein
MRDFEPVLFMMLLIGLFGFWRGLLGFNIKGLFVFDSLCGELSKLKLGSCNKEFPLEDEDIDDVVVVVGGAGLVGVGITGVVVVTGVVVEAKGGN